MDMVFDFDRRQAAAGVRFEGLDGTERVTSMKAALAVLKIRNPAASFTEAAKNGDFDRVSDEEYAGMLDTVEFLSKLWRYPEEPGDAKYELNALTLLANALEALSRLHAECRARES